MEAIAARFDELDLACVRREAKTFIYFLADDGEVVYVGRTGDVLVRVRLHLQDERISGPKAFDRVFFLEIDEADADAYEGALIRALNPRYCLRAPKDVGRDDEVLVWFGLERDPTNAFNERSASTYGKRGGA